MAVKTTTSKAVTDYLQAHPDAKKREISEALARSRRRSVKSAAGGKPEVMLASFLLSLTGGVEEAKRLAVMVKVAGVEQDADGYEMTLALALLKVAGGIDKANAALEAARKIRGI
jgi:hypothetical protein